MAKKNNGNSLVIVESPAKAKTINKYLGAGYEVIASMGHVRDLPSKGISVDIENHFEPVYEVVAGRRKVLATIKSAAKKADKLYLATDLDREGEAIAWHLAQVLGFDEEKTYRVVFNAITKTAIQEAFAEPGKIDTYKVNAQQARRILDRIVGYQISPLLWKKVARGLSAGRVQSVAVKIIVEREREIRAFQEQEYWLLPAVFTTDLNKDHSGDWQGFLKAQGPDNLPTIQQQSQWLSDRKAFKAEINKVGDTKFHADNETDAKKVLDAVKGAQFKVGTVDTKRSTSRPAAPFITSTLQQASVNRLSFSTKRTMIIAQQLYEGIDLGSMGMLGLITYMRTDSTFISPEAIRAARTYIENNVGKEYVPEKPNYFTPSEKAQQAHEAIRPTDPDLDPAHIKEFLTDEQYKLYDLIWRRFVASQMSSAQWDVTTLDIVAKTSIGEVSYRASGRVQIFDGFTKVWFTAANDQQLPPMKEGDTLGVVDLDAEKHFTKPPARYTEASLVKALEKEGIGRPSTYASIISTIQDRGYVEQIEKKFHASATGEVVTDKLNEFFPQIMDIAFTRYMEEQLDKIEVQHLDWVKVLEEFYGPFKENLDKAGEEMKHAKAEMVPSEYTCTECGANMVYRFGKNGRFLSCSKYPDCKASAPIDKFGKIITQQTTEHVCPNCGKHMVTKTGRFGAFLGCEDYPTCKTIMKLDKQGNVKPPSPPAEPTGVKCYKCKSGELVIRQSAKGPFMGCNKFPRCRTIVSMKSLEQLKELQAQNKWPPATKQEADEILGRNKAKSKSSKKTAADQ